MNIQEYEKLSASFYLNEDVVAISRSLLGMWLISRVDGKITGGRIVETEAYKGGFDRASHASKGKTKRTEVLFGDGGVAYVYLCYGIHHLFNVVTNKSGSPDCVLIRAIEPIVGIAEMMLRRSKSNLHRITSGPGMVTQALGITTSYNGVNLTGDLVWLASDPNSPELHIATATRIGVGYAGEDAQLPWRFYLENNPFVSVITK